MVRLGGRADVTAIDPGPFGAALPALLDQWRALTFADGAVLHPVSGKPHDGLRVVDGLHPRPGVAYQLMLREDHVPEPTAEEARVASRVEAADAEAAREWERGRIAAARATGRIATTWHTYAIRLETDDHTRTAFSVHHDVTGVRARVDVSDTRLTVTTRGAGWLRPFAKRPVQRDLDDFLAALPERLDALNRRIVARCPAPPDPPQLAVQMMADLISSVPVVTPGPARSA
ncbi:hypothetical protein AFR_38600 [Actinoplanes friuliensis DSM 7358]|uniref:Uncharacterized protein n=2 Tax=Actinoplanes friuliensis TaxID=196914 RepID=U5WA08_9ACTN|nr:hypothetical protein AFR_38600 [Actinoplanes friuliensis DSM 7358]